LEPNPFEQSFSGANPLSESGTNSPKPSLPPVAQLESPSAGINASDEQYGWSLQSLRSGPLSPSMLAGPQESMIFDGRTGTTPLPFGSFTDASPGTAALFGAIATSTSSAASFMNSIPVMATDHFNRSVFTQGVPKPLTDSERKTISTNSGSTVSVSGVSGVSGVSTLPTSQSGVVQPSVSATNLLGMTNGSNVNAMATNQLVLNRGLVQDAIMPKTEKDDFTQSSSNPIVVLNNVTHANGISTNITSQHKGSVLTSQSMEHDSSRSPSSSPIKSGSRSARRKAEDSLISEQPPVKKNGQKSKSDMTDEEKRRNFLERNRQGNLVNNIHHILKNFVVCNNL
jgi:ATF/CREB family transcription factor